MKFLTMILAAAVAAPAMAQDNPWFDWLPQIKQYLQLTDTQVEAIKKNGQQFNNWLVPKLQRMTQVRSEISVETGKEVLDPMALGLRYVEIEAICRQIGEHEEQARKDNAAALTEPQRAKLKTLDDAAKLFPLISEAQSAYLLPGPRVFATVSAADRFNRTDGTRLGVTYPGCGSPY